MYTITITVSFGSVPFYSGIQIAHKSTPHFHTRLAFLLALSPSLFLSLFSSQHILIKSKEISIFSLTRYSFHVRYPLLYLSKGVSVLHGATNAK